MSTDYHGERGQVAGSWAQGIMGKWMLNAQSSREDFLDNPRLKRFSAWWQTLEVARWLNSR